MADLKIKVSAETTAAEKQIKESFRSQTEAAKRQIAVQVAEYKKGLNERKAADKQIADLVKSQTKLAEKQVTDSLKSQTDASKRQIAIQTAEYKRGLAEKKAAEKQYLDSITASYKVHQKEIAAQQKAMNKKGSGGIFGGNLEFAENLTVVTAGLAAVTAGVISLGKELFETAQAGADFGILLQSFGKAGGDEAKLALLDIAAAGNLTERELITFSLQMKQVGVSVEQTTTFLRLIEQQADNTAFSFETANDGVKSFIATGATKSLKGFLSLPELKSEVEKLDDAFIASQGELTEEQAEINRTNAIFNVLNKSVGNSTDGLKDNADKVVTVSTRIANLKDRFSLAVSEGIVPFIDNLEDINFTELTKSVVESVLAIGKFIKVMSDIGGGIQTVIFSLAKIVTAYDLISNSVQFAIDKTKELLNLRDSATQGNTLLAEVGKGGVLGLGQMLPSKEDFEKNRKTTSRGGNNTSNLPFVPDKVELTQQEIYIQNLVKMNEQLKFSVAFFQTPGAFTGLGLPKVNLQDLADTVGKVAGEDAFNPEKFQSAFDTALSESQNIANILSGGADNFISKLLNGLQEAASFANSLASIISLFAGAGSGGIFGFIGGLFGGAPRSVPSINPNFQNRTTIIPFIAENRIRGNDIVTSYRRATNAEAKLINV